MKNKILLLIIAIFSFALYVGKVEAIEYTCSDSNYYVTDKIDGSGKLQCCPNEFYYVPRVTEGVTYYTCESTSIKDKKSCKSAGGFWSQNVCSADSKDALGKMTIKNVNNSSSEENIETCKFKRDKCTIDLPQLDDTSSEMFVGYSKDSSCSNIIENSIRGKSIDIKSDDFSEVYACYDKTYVKCEYEDNITILYGEKNIKTYTKNTLEWIGMPKNEMDLYYESKKYCPTTIFHYGDKTMEKFSVTKNGACGAVANFKCKSANLKKSTVIVKKNTTPTEKPSEEIKSCEDLFGENTRSIINTVMKWIRISVPILLIGLGIMDFSKAVFSSKDDDMKKAREKFIKRIVAAVLVFLVPIFVNLILDLANMAWSNINSDTCVR